MPRFLKYQLIGISCGRTTAGAGRILAGVIHGLGDILNAGNIQEW